MDVLTKYGFTIEELNFMLDTNPDINSLSEKEIYEKIDMLGKVGCMSNHIKNIFITNPFYLTRNICDIKKIIDKLNDEGVMNLYILFDSNPFILNISLKTMEENISNLRKMKYNMRDIISYFNF